jgi:SAM-dependent methyltransferase
MAPFYRSLGQRGYHCQVLTSQDWTDYYETVEALGPNPFWEKLLPFLPSSGLALDLGAGSGLGTRVLLDHGLQVLAIDAEADGLARLKARCPEAETRQSTFENLELVPESFDVVAGIFSFFFVGPADLPAFWATVTGSVKPGGILPGQLLGPNDTWVERGYSTFPKDDLATLLDGFEILFYEEHDRDGTTAHGTQKHWHVHHIVARKTMR